MLHKLTEDTGAWISALQPDNLLNSTLTPATAATFPSLLIGRGLNASKNKIKSIVEKMLLMLSDQQNAKIKVYFLQ